MTNFIASHFRDSIRTTIDRHAASLVHLADAETGHLDIDLQMRAVRLMADTILDLRSLNYSLMSPPPMPLHSMVNLCLHTSDLYAFNFALKEFAERTKTILDMEDALYGDRRGLPF